MSSLEKVDGRSEMNHIVHYQSEPEVSLSVLHVLARSVRLKSECDLTDCIKQSSFLGSSVPLCNAGVDYFRMKSKRLPVLRFRKNSSSCPISPACIDAMSHIGMSCPAGPNLK